MIKKIPDVSGLVTATVLNIKIGEVETKIPDNDKYITTQQFHKLTAENFKERLKQGDYDFDNKLISFNQKVTSNKLKYLQVRKKLNSLTAKYYNFLLGRIYFGSDDGSQNTFVFQPTFDTLELKKKQRY